MFYVFGVSRRKFRLDCLLLVFWSVSAASVGCGHRDASVVPSGGLAVVGAAGVKCVSGVVCRVVGIDANGIVLCRKHNGRC